MKNIAPKTIEEHRNYLYEIVKLKLFFLHRWMAEHPDEKYYIFGRDGGLRMAEKYQIPLLGQIPIVQSIREGGDAGEPAALSTRPDGLAFVALAEKLAETLK